MFKLNTKELETHIHSEIKPIQDSVNLKQFYFSDKTNDKEGIYIFSDHKGYHFVYSERGKETTHKITDNLFEISFWTINSLVSPIVSSLLTKNFKQIDNHRKYIFEQQLLLLEKVGVNYKKAGEIEIDEILKRNPL